VIQELAQRHPGRWLEASARCPGRAIGGLFDHDPTPGAGTSGGGGHVEVDLDELRGGEATTAVAEPLAV
jgi:hypothetical protein